MVSDFSFMFILRKPISRSLIKIIFLLGPIHDTQENEYIYNIKMPDY